MDTELSDDNGTVPAALAELVIGRPGLDALDAAGAVVTVGGRREVDLAAAAAVIGTEGADGLWAYLRRCRRFWDRAAAGDAANQRYVRTRRALVDDSQASGQGRRRDLNDAYEALSAIPVVGDVLEEACAEQPNWQLVGELVSVLSGALDVSDGVAEITFTLTGRRFDAALGGAATLGEVRRTATITVRHASWRDRRRRRLARMQVHVEEIWPEPAGAPNM